MADTYWPPGDPRNPKNQARARKDDPQTSHDAAKSVEASRNEAAVLMVLRHLGSATDHELIRGYQNLLTSPYWTKSITPQPEESIRKRRCDLMRRGLVVDTNLKRRGESGKLQTVWRAIEGRELAAKDGTMRDMLEAMQKEELAQLTEGTLFNPVDGKPRKRHDDSG